MSVRQRWFLGMMAVAVVGLIVFLVWYIQTPQGIPEGTLVQRLGVNWYV